jgi:tetratricopeptide (TPR) repeat protein
MNERLANVRFLQGDVAEARVLADRAVALWAKSGSPDPLQRALALIARSQVAQAESDLPAARRHADDARAQVASLGDDNLYSLAARLQLALIDLDERRPAIAVAELEAIVAVIERDYGLDARWLVEPLTALGRAYQDAGRLLDARVALQRAAPIADAAAFVAARAEIDLALARVAWADGDPARARSLATTAADVYRRIGAGRSLAEAEAWLRDHPLP